MNKIVTLDDLVARDQKDNVKQWIIWKCEEAMALKKIVRGWDGESIEGEPVLAFVNNGRWLGRCKVCSNPIYVSPNDPLLYCPECGNGGTRAAWPVAFPQDRVEIESALLERAVELIDPARLVRNDVERALHSRPEKGGLARSWRPGISLDKLREDNEKNKKDKEEKEKR